MSDMATHAHGGPAGGAGHGHDHGHGHGHDDDHGHDHDHGREERRYLRVFKLLRPGETVTVKHGMRAFPLVDLYALMPFEVVSSADEMSDAVRVALYLYHTTDGSAQVRGEGGVRRITLEDSREPSGRIPFAAALRSLGVEHGDDTHLGDVVLEFWKALFSPPSDPFDETTFANSPWIDRCCGDRRSVGEVKRGGGWDDLWLLLRPVKSVTGPPEGGGAAGTDPRVLDAMMAILQGDRGRAVELIERVRSEAGGGLRDSGTRQWVEVTQLGMDTVGLRLMGGGDEGRDELPAMVLLRA